MERGESSGGDPSLMGPTDGISDQSLMEALGGIDYPSLMEPFDGFGGGLPSQMNVTPEDGPSNQSVGENANNGIEENPGDGGAARTTEVNPSTATKNKKKRSDRQQDGAQPNKKMLHRVTSQQLEILEGFFSVCAHPDDNQRRQLSQSTGLLLHQVKFWFQNKRTQVKHLSGREENYRLKVENETLKEENNRLRLAHSNAPAPASCPRCINDPGHLLQEVERLKAENQMLQQELQLLQGTDVEIPIAMDSASDDFQLDPSLENVFPVQSDEQMIANLAQNAAQEFLILADPNSPLWLNVPGSSFETLNLAAYAQTFPGWMSAVGTMALKTEATRASAVVMLDSKSLVEFLLNAESYGTMLPGLVSGAATTMVYNGPTSREKSYDGALQMMTIELVFPSPLVSARKCTFVRYCKKLEEGGIAVVDVSLDGGDGFRKMPSGLLIEPIRYNSCKVTAIDHVIVDGTYTHDLFHPCPSGLLFGARRWVTSMARQCARIRDVFHVTNCTLRVTSRGRKTMMKLADNLLANFNSSVAGYPEDAWTVQCGVGTEQDIKIMYKTQNESSSNLTAVVCATASFVLPLYMKKAFDLLKNNLLRAKWDILVNGGSVKEEVRVANGAGSDDAVSILHVKHGHGANKNTMMILQNTSYDASGAFMVYSSLDMQLLEIITNPGNNQAMSNIGLFPTGFSLVPLTNPEGQDGAGIAQPGATVMTAGFQVLMKLAHGTGLCPRSVTSALQIMTDSIANIKEALLNSHPVFYQSIKSVN